MFLFGALEQGVQSARVMPCDVRRFRTRFPTCIRRARPQCAPRDLDSVGAAAGPELRVASGAEGDVEPLPQGEEGEVLVRGACVMARQALSCLFSFV